MDGGVGHTAWAPEGREGRSQAGPKGRQLEVGPRRGPRLLVHHNCKCKPKILLAAFIATISHGCRFHELLHQHHNISWLQISWDITLLPKYFVVTDFMRYYTRTTILQYLIVADFMRQNINYFVLLWYWIFSKNSNLVTWLVSIVSQCRKQVPSI